MFQDTPKLFMYIRNRPKTKCGATILRQNLREKTNKLVETDSLVTFFFAQKFVQWAKTAIFLLKFLLEIT